MRAPCPNCGASSAERAAECARCGIVFAKFEAREALAAQVRAASAELAADGPALSHSTQTADSASREREWSSAASRPAQAVILVLLAIWTWQFARMPMGTAALASFLHLPNLIFHEAGHVILGFLGRFIMVLGGSLFQFALPLALAAVFLKQFDRTGAIVCIWWAGQNLVDLAPYIADARALTLPLLGGRTGAEVEGHDWEYLLTTLGWLRYDRTLALAAHRTGLTMMISALAWGTVALVREWRENRG